jgi:hypothetical protein
MEATSLTDAVWGLFVQTSLLEASEAGTGRAALEQMGLDPISADALFEHMRSALESRKNSDLEGRATLCSKRDQVTTREDFAREAAVLKQRGDQERALAVESVSEVVDASAHTKVLVVAEELRSSTTTLNIDPAVYLATLPESAVGDVMQRICGPKGLTSSRKTVSH